MFERQIGYDLLGSQQKGRSPYFGLSTGFVAFLFASFLVASIFADDFSLPGEGLDLTSMLAPANAEPVTVEPKKAAAPTTRSSSSTLPTRTALVARVDEANFVPDKIGVTPSNVPPRPYGQVVLNKVNSDGFPRSSVERPAGGNDIGSQQSFGPSDAKDRTAVRDEPDIPPPPVVDRRPRNVGVVNSKATFLPKPTYPETALRMGLSGTVTVQVLIDEEGRVISATASDGNALFRASALNAAKRAKFTPTLLSKVPIKVTGVIVYHFTR